MPITAETTQLSLAEQIEEEILAGDLAPGSHLAEVKLAQRFGVSRTPLRQALAKLAEMGWVRLVPNVGAFVREIPAREVAELFHVREQLEGLAAELLASHWNDELSARLQGLADAYREHRLAGRYYETRMANCLFHRAIVDASGCEALAETVTRMRLILRSEMARHPFEPQLGQTPPDAAVTHYDLLDALASGQPRQAREAAVRHLEQVRVRLLGLG
ncbi:MAG: GntR family transcriptional regulator [Planctomycetota bacterium]|nr:GntR family transcriptional regulator [Planctomycetota bacterium]